MSDTPIKTNLMDVLVLLLKAAVKANGPGELRLEKSTVLMAENADLHMARGLDGAIVLKLVQGDDPASSKIILPAGQSPLTLL